MPESVIKWPFLSPKFSDFFYNNAKKRNWFLCSSFWCNYNLDVLEISKWPSEPNFCERSTCSLQKMARNCLKSVIFEAWFDFGCLLIFLFPLTVRSSSKIGQNWYETFYEGPPFDVFWFCNLPKIQKGGPYKTSNFNAHQSSWKFAQLKEMKK